MEKTTQQRLMKRNYQINLCFISIYGSSLQPSWIHAAFKTTQKRGSLNILQAQQDQLKDYCNLFSHTDHLIFPRTSPRTMEQSPQMSLKTFNFFKDPNNIIKASWKHFRAHRESSKTCKTILYLRLLIRWWSSGSCFTNHRWAGVLWAGPNQRDHRPPDPWTPRGSCVCVCVWSISNQSN